MMKSSNIEKQLEIMVYAAEFPTVIGGAGVFTFRLCDYLSKKNFKITVLTRHFSEDDRAFDRKQGFKVIRMPKYGNTLLAYLFGTTWFLFYLCRIKPENILAADILSQRIISLLSPFLRKRKVYLLAHGSEVTANYNEKGLKKKIFTSLYNRVDNIIANSNFTKGLLVRKGIPEDKVIVINPGLEEEWFVKESDAQEIRKRFNLADEKIILTVARLSPRKGHAIVLSQMPRLLREVPGIKYLIVGDGEETSRLKQIVSRNRLEKQVIFAGRVKDKDLIRYYDACDIFVMPTQTLGNLTEGFGISFIEAGARGKPVVGMRTGGVSDAVVDGSTGYLVEPGDISGFSAKIIKLLKDQETASSLGRNAKKYVYDKFYWENVKDFPLTSIFQAR